VLDCTACRNTQVLFQLTEILLDHNFLSENSGIGLHKFQCNRFVRCMLTFVLYMLQYIIIIVKIQSKQYSSYILCIGWAEWNVW
jgi:hypothetical protein